MNFVSHANTRRILMPSLVVPLLLAAVTAFAFGAHRPSDSSERRSGSPPVVAFRAKPSMARQPRPASAPIRHLDQRADGAVKLLGIESLHN